MSANTDSLERGRDGRIEPEQLASVADPVDDNVDVFGPSADVEGEVSHTGVMEAVEQLANDTR